MDSQTAAKTNAKKAWSQLLYSIISDNPPPSMTRGYYYARPLPIQILQEQLKSYGMARYNLRAGNALPQSRYNFSTLAPIQPPKQRNRYEQEIRHIQDRLEFAKHSEKLRANKDRYQQWTEHIRFFMRIVSNEAVRANKGGTSNKEWNKQIKYLTWRIRTIMTSILDDEMVQVNEDKYQQGIEHIQSVTRSNVVQVDNVLVQANEEKYLQGMEHIRSLTRSNGVSMDDEQVQENEDKYQQGIEHIQSFTRSNVARVDNEVVQANEDKYQQGIEHIQSFTRSNAAGVDNEVVQANEDKYQQGIEHIQSLMRSNLISVDDEVLQADEDKYQQGIEYIQSVMRSNVGNELVHEKEGKHQQGIEHMQSVMGTTVDEEMVQACEAENQDEIEHERAVLLSLLAFLEFVEDQIWEENQTLRSEVLEAYELMHENGAADIVRSQIEGKDPKIQYQEKRLELLLRICDREICLRIIDTELQKVGGDVYCKHCEMSQTNEDGNELGIKHTKELSNLFDNLLELVESRDVHKEKKPAVQVKVLKLIKILHHYGVDTIRNAVEKELEDVKQKYDDTVEDPSIQYKKKGLEVMLRICGNKSYERTINKIGHKAEREYDPCNFILKFLMT